MFFLPGLCHSSLVLSNSYIGIPIPGPSALFVDFLDGLSADVRGRVLLPCCRLLSRVWSAQPGWKGTVHVLGPPLEVHKRFLLEKKARKAIELLPWDYYASTAFHAMARITEYFLWDKKCKGRFEFPANLTALQRLMLQSCASRIYILESHCLTAKVFRTGEGPLWVACFHSDLGHFGFNFSVFGSGNNHPVWEWGLWMTCGLRTKIARKFRCMLTLTTCLDRDNIKFLIQDSNPSARHGDIVKCVFSLTVSSNLG